MKHNLFAVISYALRGMMITAKNKTNRQKNGNVHYCVYYRCTKKSKIMKCKKCRSFLKTGRAVIILNSKNFFARRKTGWRNFIVLLCKTTKTLPRLWTKLLLVPRAGLEPACVNATALNRVCIPVPPPGQYPIL